MANPTPTKAPPARTQEQVDALRAEEAKIVSELADMEKKHEEQEPEPEPEPEPEACQPSPAKSYTLSPAKQASTPQPQDNIEPLPISSFVVGGPVIILSPKLKWRECTIVGLEPCGSVYHDQKLVATHMPCIKVSYVGFNQAFDEWLCLAHDSNRIRLAPTRAAAKLRAGLGELSPNQRLQEHKKAEMCLPWLNNSPVKPMAALK
jgi:hypothetical protein